MTTPNFDPVARIYRWAEYAALGPLLQRVRTHFLPALDPARRALILGDGDGRFLAALLRRNTRLQAHAVDSSARMLTLLRNRCSFASARLTTQQASLLDLAPTAPAADLIVTHFVLDCFDQPTLNRLIPHITAHAQPGALWLLSDFGTPRSRLLQPFAALYIRALYASFRALTGLRTRSLPDHARPLSLAGWQRLATHTLLNGFLYTELWQRGYNPLKADATPDAPESSTPL